MSHRPQTWAGSASCWNTARQRDGWHCEEGASLRRGSPQARTDVTPRQFREIHVLEYLWKAAWCFHDKAGPDIEAFVARHARTILAGACGQVVDDLRTAAKTTGLPEDKVAAVEKTCTYLENKQPWLRYDTALAADWPIATGIIEGACRHLVKDRLDITGARWSPGRRRSRAETPGLIANGDFEDYWAWHVRGEHRRIHQARYQDKLTLAA